MLLRILHERFIACNAESDCGLALLFTQLDAENEERLLSLILETAHLNSMTFQFLDWLETANRFYFISFDQ